MTVMRADRVLPIKPTLAHQGGWDEALMIFGIPLVLFVVMRWLAGRRKPDEHDGGH
jgi:hypothetical protein